MGLMVSGAQSSPTKLIPSFPPEDNLNGGFIADWKDDDEVDPIIFPAPTQEILIDSSVSINHNHTNNSNSNNPSTKKKKMMNGWCSVDASPFP